MKIAAYYRPPKQVSDIDNKLFKEEVHGLRIRMVMVYSVV
jgi:hypothetical protein